MLKTDLRVEETCAENLQPLTLFMLRGSGVRELNQCCHAQRENVHKEIKNFVRSQVNLDLDFVFQLWSLYMATNEGLELRNTTFTTANTII